MTRAQRLVGRPPPPPRQPQLPLRPPRLLQRHPRCKCPNIEPAAKHCLCVCARARVSASILTRCLFNPFSSAQSIFIVTWRDVTYVLPGPGCLPGLHRRCHRHLRFLLRRWRLQGPRRLHVSCVQASRYIMKVPARLETFLARHCWQGPAVERTKGANNTMRTFRGCATRLRS